MEFPRPTAQRGFTLVEIAIVLVIIGLLLGGVLKGQEMITQARIKNVMNDLNGVSSAFFAYQDRYKQIPGDDNGAAARWTNATGLASGDGNGQILGAYDAAPTGAITAANESNLFWWDLRLAEFIPGATSGAQAYGQPLNAMSGKIGVTTDGGGTSGANGTAGLAGIIVCSQHLPDKIAGAVDTQMDDGNPGTGTVHGLFESGGTPTATGGTLPTSAPTWSSTQTNYPETGSTNYVVCRQI